jgi:hypothetical protein
LVLVRFRGYFPLSPNFYVIVGDHAGQLVFPPIAKGNVAPIVRTTLGDGSIVGPLDSL